MSTQLKTEFDWVKKNNTIVVYSDHARFFRDSLLFTEVDKKITPHQAIKMSIAENIKIDLRMLSSDKRTFVSEILIGHGVLTENII